jgi:hypothetical protein
MPSTIKPLLRLARAISAQLASFGSSNRLVELPTCTWDRCAQLVRQIRRAELRGWHLAAEELRRDLDYTISTLHSELTSIASQASRIPTTKALATFGDVYRDLLALEEEFDEVDHDLRGRWLSVTTEPITLQGIYLGPFEIELDWGRTGDDCAYRVIANDPHPATSRDNVTHPHVMDDRLCEGHSRQAIRQALSHGRLLDFFTIVANGLRTYNEDSPFVSLEIWHGASCSDCGAVVDEENRYICQRCEETVCQGCEVACCGCDDCYCSQCMSGCEACDDNFCCGCLKPCQQCRRNICCNCLEEDERCSACHEKQDREDDTDPATGGAAVQPVCVGQASVSA